MLNHLSLPGREETSYLNNEILLTIVHFRIKGSRVHGFEGSWVQVSIEIFSLGHLNPGPPAWPAGRLEPFL
jgi:hypothetical protein